MRTVSAPPRLSLARTLCLATRDKTLSRLTLREVAVLAALDEAAATGSEHAISNKTLAARLGVGKPSITRSLNRLSIEGLLVNALHPTDRRLRAISITESGRGAMAKMAGVEEIASQSL